MIMTRRGFLKSLASLAAISYVPSINSVVNDVPEPKWIIEEFDFGTQVGVGAEWIIGKEKIRHAVSLPIYVFKNIEKETAINYSKQALRQWYLEKHIKKAA